MAGGHPTEHTRGPWHTDHCHAGPPTGLLARAMEQLLPTQAGQRLTRMTVTLTRPIPFAGFQVFADIARQGRTVSQTRARIVDAEQNICASADGLHIRQRPESDLPTYRQHFGSASDASPGSFPISSQQHSLPAFNHGVETRYPPGQNAEPGPTTLWLKTVPLLPDEIPAPFQRICPLADCGNAIGRNADPDTISFINADLTLMLHRDPAGQWLGSQSVGYWESNGIGMADALLFDEQGVVGRAVQSLLLTPVQD